jgi:hypothetical protein
VNRAELFRIGALPALTSCFACGEARSPDAVVIAPTVVAAPSASAPPVLAPPPSASALVIVPPPLPVPEERPPTPPTAAAEQAARDALKKISTVTPGTLGTASEKCVEESCHWAWPVNDAGGGSLGTIAVDEKTSAVTYEVMERDAQSRTIDEYLRCDKDSKRALAALDKLPDLKAICAQAQAAGSGCIEYVSDDSGGPCPGTPNELSGVCLWGIYVGSNMGTHASRIATFWVEPKSFTVVGVSEMMCDKPMPLAVFRAREKARQAGKSVDDCP